MISTSKPQTAINSRNFSEKPEIHSLGKQSVEKSAKRRMRPPMPGGMLLKHIRGAFQIVSGFGWTYIQPHHFVHHLAVAIQALTQTIVHLTSGGRFRQAADREKEIAQIYLQDSNDLPKACESYVRAGEWYAQEDAAAYVP